MECHWWVLITAFCCQIWLFPCSLHARTAIPEHPGTVFPQVSGSLETFGLKDFWGTVKKWCFFLLAISFFLGRDVQRFLYYRLVMLKEATKLCYYMFFSNMFSFFCSPIHQGVSMIQFDGSHMSYVLKAKKVPSCLTPNNPLTKVAEFSRCFSTSSRKQRNTLPETNIAPKNGWLEYLFPLGMAYFQGLC